LGKLPNLALEDKDPALSDHRMSEAGHTKTGHPETTTTPEGDIDDKTKQMSVDTAQSYNQEEIPPKTKKKGQARRKRNFQPTGSEPCQTKKTKFDNVSKDTEPMAGVNNVVTGRDDTFPPPHESTTDVYKNESGFSQSNNISQPFVTGVTMFSDAPYESNNDSVATAAPNENPKKKRPRRKKHVNSQSSELMSKKIKLSVSANGSIVDSTLEEVPLPQEGLEKGQYDNETNFPQPVVSSEHNITSDGLNKDGAIIAPQENYPQVKKRRQKRRKKQTNSQSTKFDFVPNKMHSEIELLPECVNTWNDSTLPPPQTENLNEPAFVATSEPGFTMFSETLRNEVSDSITPVPPNNNPPQMKKKRWNKRRGKRASPSELDPSIMKETTLDNAPCDESTTFSHTKKRKPRRKGKRTYEERTVKFPSSYASLPSIASNAWQDVFPSYVSFSDNQSYQLRSKSGFVPDQLVSNSVDVVDIVL